MSTFKEDAQAAQALGHLDNNLDQIAEAFLLIESALDSIDSGQIKIAELENASYDATLAKLGDQLTSVLVEKLGSINRIGEILGRTSKKANWDGTEGEIRVIKGGEIIEPKELVKVK